MGEGTSLKLRNLLKLAVEKDLTNLMTIDSEWERSLTMDVRWVIDGISEVEEIMKGTGKEKEIENVIELGLLYFPNNFLFIFSFFQIILSPFWFYIVDGQ